MLMFILISERGSLTDRNLNNEDSGLEAPGSSARTQRRRNEQGWLCDGAADEDLRGLWVCVCVCVCVLVTKRWSGPGDEVGAAF